METICEKRGWESGRRLDWETGELPFFAALGSASFCRAWHVSLARRRSGEREGERGGKGGGKVV